MCHLNLLVRRQNGYQKGLISFLQSVSASSFAQNPDGDGVYFTNKVIKGRKKINFYGIKKQLENSKIILSHQRIATSGFHGRYIHPFLSEEFVLVHNGILTSFVEKNHSDTYMFFKKFHQVFNNLEGTRKERIVKTIKELLDENYGSFSIGLFDKTDKMLYYFKNNRTSIKVYINPRMIYLTTSEKNGIFLDLMSTKWDERDLEDNKIYSISEDLDIKVEGEIKDKIQTTIKEWNTTEPSEDYQEEMMELNHVMKCLYCNKSTNAFNIKFGEAVCWDCVEEGYV